jgi:predicted transcriptional regulator
MMREKRDRVGRPAISLFRPDRPGIRKALGDLEADVMEVVWTRRPARAATVRDVYEVLSRRRSIAYTTVMTTMARLARKGLLRVEKEGTAYVYSEALSRNEFISRVLGRVVEDLLVGFSEGATGRLRARVDPKVVARARRLLEEIARRRSGEESE